MYLLMVIELVRRSIKDALPDNDGDRDKGFVLLTKNLAFECNTVLFNDRYLT